MNRENRVIRCDGCGEPAMEEHVRRRIERLELATRFRPIHIGVLFLGIAPPPRLEDYFYRTSRNRDERSGLGRLLFDELLAGVGLPVEAGKEEESVLYEFQRRGFLLADCIECPLEEMAKVPEASEIAFRFGPSVANRIRFSYKPRSIVLLSQGTRPMIPVLEKAGLGGRLLLARGEPIELPGPGIREERSRFRSALGQILLRAARLS